VVTPFEKTNDLDDQRFVSSKTGLHDAPSFREDRRTCSRVCHQDTTKTFRFVAGPPRRMSVPSVDTRETETQSAAHDREQRSTRGCRTKEIGVMRFQRARAYWSPTTISPTSGCLWHGSWSVGSEPGNAELKSRGTWCSSASERFRHGRRANRRSFVDEHSFAAAKTGPNSSNAASSMLRQAHHVHFATANLDRVDDLPHRVREFWGTAVLIRLDAVGNVVVPPGKTGDNDHFGERSRRVRIV